MNKDRFMHHALTFSLNHFIQLQDHATKTKLIAIIFHTQANYYLKLNLEHQCN